MSSEHACLHPYLGILDMCMMNSTIELAGPSQRLFFKVIGVTSYPHFNHHFHSSTGCKPNPCVSLSQECTHVVFLLSPLMNMGNMLQYEVKDLFFPLYIYHH